MAGLLVWLIVSHAFVMGIGTALIRSDAPWPGAALLFGVPALRVAARFRAAGGYRLIGHAGQVHGNLGDRGGFASRKEEPRWFRFCLACELAVIAAIFALYFLAPLRGG